MKSIKILTALFTLSLAFMATASAQDSNNNEMSEVKEVQHYVHAHGMPIKGKILMVTSSPAISKQTGWPIGFWGQQS
jgi:hypothetical protein